ncbi:MAG: MFS transporter [Pseudomonadota bacterium]
MSTPRPTNASSQQILAASTLAIILSTVGQNSVLGVFLEQQSNALGITELHFCLLLAASTLLAAAGMRWLQPYIASWRTSTLAALTALASAGSLMLWGVIAAAKLALGIWGALLLLTLCFTGIRLFLRGMFKILGATVVNEQAASTKRAKTMALSNALAGIVFAALPLLTHGLLERVGFELTMVVFAVASVVVGVLIFRVTSMPREEAAEALTDVAAEQGPSIPLDAAKRSPQFWIYAFGVPLSTLITSSASLMILPIAHYAGVSPPYAYAIYLPAMFVGFPCVYFATRTMHHHRVIFIAHQLALVITTLGFLFIATPLGFWATSIGFGAAAGLYTAMASNLWPTVYGTHYAKAYYGYATAIDLGASALGPVLFGVVHHFWGVQVALLLVLPLPLLGVLLMGVTHLTATRARQVSTGTVGARRPVDAPG